MMEEDEKSLSDYLAALRRRRGLMLSVMALILAISIGLALGLPAVYKSEATILIEQQEVPQDLVRTLVTSYADQRIHVIRQRVMSTSNLVGLIEKYDLYKEDRTKKPIEVIVKQMHDKDISLEMISADVVDPRSGRAMSATIAFSLAYESESPKLAQSIANELVTLFLNENIKNRTETAIEASTFLAEEAEKLRTNIAKFEEKLAEFKENNAETLPELAQLNLQMMNRTEQEILEVKRQITSLNERKIYLAAELSQQPETIDEQRYNPAYDIQRQRYDMALQEYQYELQRRNRVVEPDTRLEALQTEYLAAVSKYSPGHPDVRRLEREIDSLKTEVGTTSSDTTLLDDRIEQLGISLSTARDRYSADHPDVQRYEKQLAELEKQRNSKVVEFSGKGSSDFPSYNVTQPRYLIKERPNPAHVQLKSQLDASDTELLTLNNKIEELESKFLDYESRLTKTPQVEREYANLTRDYQAATSKYNEITTKQMEAQLAQSLESERKGERFTLIEPPLLPEEPAKPNRLAIAFLGLVFSLAAGIGVAALAEAMDDAVRGRHGILEVMGETPLAVIPYIETTADLRKKMLNRSLMLTGTLASAVVAAVLFHWFILPLDVLWFAGLRKLGL